MFDGRIGHRRRAGCPVIRDDRFASIVSRYRNKIFVRRLAVDAHHSEAGPGTYANGDEAPSIWSPPVAVAGPPPAQARH
jgi:hypothetical protein